MGKLGDAYVEINTDLRPLDRGLKTAEARVASLLASTKGEGMGGLAKSLAGGAGMAVATKGLDALMAAPEQLGRALLDCTLKASDLGESLSKTRTTFGKDAGKIEGFADEMAGKFGLVKKESIDAATSIGLIGKASGMGGQEAAALGVDMARLAADISSFHNVGMDEALTTIRSGLVGEAEPLRRFGVLLSEDAVKVEALRLGLARTSSELSEQAKVRARISLIKNAAALQPVQGDLERTADSAANQVRKLQGDLENFKTKVGESFIGALTEGIGVLRGFGEDLHDAFGTEPIEAAGAALKAFLGTMKGARGAAKDFGEEYAGAINFVLDAMARTPTGLALQLGKNAVSGGKDPDADLKALQAESKARKEKEKEKTETKATEDSRPAGRKAFDDYRDSWGLNAKTPEEAREARQRTGQTRAEQEASKGYTFEAYEAAQKKSGLSPEGYDEARKKSLLPAEAYDTRQNSYLLPKGETDPKKVFGAMAARGRADIDDRKRNEAVTRGLENKGIGRGLGQLARQFGEKALSAVSAVPDLASKDRATSLAAQGRLQGATGLLGPIGGAGGRLLAAGGQAVGAMGRGVEAGKEQRARLGPSQVMGADDFARNNLTESFNQERDKQLAEQEKANAKLDEVKEVLGEILKKTGGAGVAILRGRS